MNIPISLIIFNYDGILMDTERIAIQINITMLAKLN